MYGVALAELSGDSYYAGLGKIIKNQDSFGLNIKLKTSSPHIDSLDVKNVLLLLGTHSSDLYCLTATSAISKYSEYSVVISKLMYWALRAVEHLNWTTAPAKACSSVTARPH